MRFNTRLLEHPVAHIEIPPGFKLGSCYSQVGDVIYIEASSGAVKRVGRCDVHATEFDLEADEYVPLPKVRYHTAACKSSSLGPSYFST